MKSRLLIAAASAALMAAPSIASADDSEGWYLRGNAGYGTHTDADLSGGIVGDVESEGNVALSLGLGYDFGNNWRLELDGATLWTDNGAIAQLPSSFAKFRTNSAMLNAIYDFDDFGRWAPYVGAGIGVVRAKADLAAHDFLSVDNAIVSSPACPGDAVANQGFSCETSSSDAGLGWQLLAGLGYGITDNLTWDTQYRYLDAGDFDFTGSRGNQVTGLSAPINVLAEGLGAHSLLTGFRYRFGGATPPPPPPAPVATADYKCWDGSMVFNAGQCPAEPAPQPTVSCWDGSLVFDAAECPSAETRNTINRILDIGEYCNVDNIRVVGHTDSSGSAAYNLGLSKRRAKDARDELVRQGIAGERITSDGKGETELFVQTGDGVKEQLNRRTEVLITLGSVGVIN